MIFGVFGINFAGVAPSLEPPGSMPDTVMLASQHDAAIVAAAAAAAAATAALASGCNATMAPAGNPSTNHTASEYDGGDAVPNPQQAQHSRPEQLSYAAIREAAAVNQAADGAADEAMRVVAAAQQTLHMMMAPPQAPMGMHSTAAGDDAGHSTHHPSGRARRNRTNTVYADHGAASLMALANAHGMYGGGRPNKGLRHFSMKVCEKVESKGTTSYNEVADELVAELKDGGMDDGICYDEKNIRRRVYDAINVLMALDIIAKEKKAIIWKGFPTSRSAAQQVSAHGAACHNCVY